MIGARDTSSMVGASSRRTQHVDTYPWIRGALIFTGVTVEMHEALAERADAAAAAEVLLLVISRQRGTDNVKWQQARDLRIPWLDNRWSNLNKLQQYHNTAATNMPDPHNVENDAVPTELP